MTYRTVQTSQAWSDLHKPWFEDPPPWIDRSGEGEQNPTWFIVGGGRNRRWWTAGIFREKEQLRSNFLESVAADGRQREVGEENLSRLVSGSSPVGGRRGYFWSGRVDRAIGSVERFFRVFRNFPDLWNDFPNFSIYRKKIPNFERP